jgi:hypothetical protein
MPVFLILEKRAKLELSSIYHIGVVIYKKIPKLISKTFNPLEIQGGVGALNRQEYISYFED